MKGINSPGRKSPIRNSPGRNSPGRVSTPVRKEQEEKEQIKNEEKPKKEKEEEESSSKLNKSKSRVGEWGILLFVIITHGYFLYILKDEYEKNPYGTEPRNFVSMGAPLMVLSVIVEAIWSRKKDKNNNNMKNKNEKKIVRINDGVTSINTGALSELFKKVLHSLSAFSPYVWIYENLALTRYFQNPSLFSWVAMFVLVDFLYYWLHRTGHTIRALWACHSVHHSSEDYNLTTALRQSSFHTLASWVYYLPLAFFFPPMLFFYHSQFNLLYQFWIHTEAVGKLGPFEWIFSTPSQHRVHHGRNEYCIDKNYGGTLCIFDRLFGTFAEEREDEPVVYGLTHSLNTMNPVSANTQIWTAIWQDLKKADGFYNKFLVLYNGPGWIPGTPDNSHQYPIPPITKKSLQKYDPQLGKHVSNYILGQLLFYLLLHTIVMASSVRSQIWIMTAYLFLFSYSFGCLLDRKSFAPFFEIFRLAASVVFLWVAEFHLGFQLANALIAVFSFIFILKKKSELTQPLKNSEKGLAGID